MEPIKEGVHLYVSYVITLDTQQDFVEWTKGTSTRITIIEGTIIGMTKGMITTMIIVKKK